MKNSIIVLIFTLFFTACSSEEDDSTNVPVNDITYTKNIKNIIDTNCINCHASTPTNGAPMSLVTLEEVKEATQNRDLIGRIEDGSMPPGDEVLTEEQINMIKDWETNSFK